MIGSFYVSLANMRAARVHADALKKYNEMMTDRMIGGELWTAYRKREAGQSKCHNCGAPTTSCGCDYCGTP
jgi:ribosomal protein L34E